MFDDTKQVGQKIAARQPTASLSRGALESLKVVPRNRSPVGIAYATANG
jgi:hypothetical protein